MNKSQAKFQHYIPRFQLRYLLDKDEQLYVYDKKQNIIRKQSLNSIGGVNKIYTYKDKEGKEHTEVEDLNTQIEGIAAPIIKELHSGKKTLLTGQEKADLSVLLALNWQRTPAAKERTELLLEAGATMFFRANALDKEAFHKRAAEIEKKTGKDFGDKEKLRQSILDNRYRIKFDNLAYLQALVVNLLDIAAEIQNMAWQVNIIKDKKSFIFPDVNFTIEQVEPAPQPYGERGLLTPGTQSMCVLTNKVVITMLPFAGRTFFINPTMDFVKSSNTINAVRAQRFIFSNSDALLQSVVKRTKLYNIPSEKIGVKVYSGIERKEFVFTNKKQKSK